MTHNYSANTPYSSPVASASSQRSYPRALSSAIRSLWTLCPRGFCLPAHCPRFSPCKISIFTTTPESFSHFSTTTRRNSKTSFPSTPWKISFRDLIGGVVPSYPMFGGSLSVIFFENNSPIPLSGRFGAVLRDRRKQKPGTYQIFQTPHIGIFFDLIWFENWVNFKFTPPQVKRKTFLFSPQPFWSYRGRVGAPFEFARGFPWKFISNFPNSGWDYLQRLRGPRPFLVGPWRSHVGHQCRRLFNDQFWWRCVRSICGHLFRRCYIFSS